MRNVIYVSKPDNILSTQIPDIVTIIYNFSWLFKVHINYVRHNHVWTPLCYFSFLNFV
jgi:hypothetical protein